MAKRYGRNQRRKHREQIADQALLVAAISAQLQTQRRKYINLENQMDEWGDRIGHLLGRYSSLRRDIEPKFCEEINRFFYMHQESGTLRPTEDFTDVRMLTMPEPIKLIHLCESVQPDYLMPLKKIVTLLLIEQLHQERRCYAVSEDFVKMQTTDPRLVKELGELIAKALLEASFPQWKLPRPSEQVTNR